MFDLSPVYRHELTADEVDGTDGGIIHNLPHSEDNFMSTTETNAKTCFVDLQLRRGRPVECYNYGQFSFDVFGRWACRFLFTRL